MYRARREIHTLDLKPALHTLKWADRVYRSADAYALTSVVYNMVYNQNHSKKDLMRALDANAKAILLAGHSAKLHALRANLLELVYQSNKSPDIKNDIIHNFTAALVRDPSLHTARVAYARFLLSQGQVMKAHRSLLQGLCWSFYMELGRSNRDEYIHVLMQTYKLQGYTKKEAALWVHSLELNRRKYCR